MDSTRMFKTFSSVIWYCNTDTKHQDLIEQVKQADFNIELAFTEEELKSKYQSTSPSFFVIDQPSNLERCIELVKSGKQHAKDSPFTTILLTDKIATSEKDRYYQAEGDDILLTPISNTELIFKLKHYQNLYKRKSEFNLQLEEASQMALLAMENSSDLGGILNFVKQTMNAKSYQELAEHIFDATHPYCDSAIVEIKGHDDLLYFSSDERVDPDMKRFLIAQKPGNRVIQSDSTIQINNNNLVVLLDGLPQNDQDKMGRISDTLAMLCDTANRFAESIATEENLSSTEESRRKFLTTLSHELKTPLNSILGFSKALKGRNEDTPLGKMGFDALGRIIESTDQINAIISTLIEISSASINTKDISRTNFKVSAITSKLEHEFRETAEKKNLDFEVHSPDGLMMLGDEPKIYSMLHHLLENAFKFTNTGQVKVSCDISLDPSHGRRIIFKVSDTGIGIDPKDHQRIFTEVGQLNSEHNREHYGVGIGLYYVYLLSKQFGGTISVNSNLNEGAEFTLDLPAEEIIEDASPCESTQEQEIDDLLF